ncbi:hypothetical protein SE15_12200 [Thermanaerothrix daxensis]|uniref:histidine kinase n=1 Tax=Thermanaerothrix daxensis TaxID=869279 RepID=A0A0P6Y194_9CHLR|nr:ATP-binding protein [Thermanaerothrix daxensis]KPL82807.1 hypothetical protein SE15_12200 [Thermanaerothrix daxensis]
MSFMLPDFRIRQRDYLLEITRALTQELDLDVLLGRILRITIEMLAGQAGLIALREEDGSWKVAVAQGIPEAFVKFLAPYLNEITESPDPDYFELLEIDHRLRELALTASFGLLHGVVLPLVARNRVLGVIFIFRSYPAAFSANDRALLTSFADQAAIAVSNAQLYTQLARSKQRLDGLLDAVADGVLILNPDLKVERCNPAFARLLGIPREKIQGNPHEAVVNWASPPKDMTLEQAVAGGWPLMPNAYLYVEGDLKCQGPRNTVPVGITYAPLLSEGKLLNIIAIVRDITRFREADELKSTFISIISHELKTPLALIKGYVSTLRREDAQWDPEIVQESLAIIEEEADRLGALIENLLDASRLQAGGLTLKRADVWLPELASRVSQRMATQTSRHTIVVDFPTDFPVILADEDRLQQVLTNLISNAIKYAPQGEIRISGRVQPDVVIVCVSDQGPGIAPSDRPHIFDRFYRSPEVMRQTKGAGLGLYLSRAIIEAHGGKIWVDSGTEQGARICFSLPRQSQ